NATQILHINWGKPSDLKPAYIVDTVHHLMERILTIPEDDPLSKEVQINSSLTFRMHVHATLATRHILEQFHL
ncbi:RNA polymerase Rpb1, domain 6-domain-containing protein, partial [Boletus edulis]